MLFVCTGNICRSPTAEGVFRALVERAGLEGRIRCDSAGTHGYHVGEAPDLRTQVSARRRGYELGALRARQVAPQDFEEFDLILAMDRANMAALRGLQPANARTSPVLFLEYVAAPGTEINESEVGDPYYGDGRGFDDVLNVIETGAAKLLAMLSVRRR